MQILIWSERERESRRHRWRQWRGTRWIVIKGNKLQLEPCGVCECRCTVSLRRDANKHIRHTHARWTFMGGLTLDADGTRSTVYLIKFLSICVGCSKIQKKFLFQPNFWGVILRNWNMYGCKLKKFKALKCASYPKCGCWVNMLEMFVFRFTALI